MIRSRRERSRSCSPTENIRFPTGRPPEHACTRLKSFFVAAKRFLPVHIDFVEERVVSATALSSPDRRQNRQANGTTAQGLTLLAVPVGDMGYERGRRPCTFVFGPRASTPLNWGMDRAIAAQVLTPSKASGGVTHGVQGILRASI
jgi:hypothetical protein